MSVFGSALARVKQVLSPVDSRGGGWHSLFGRVREPFPGAWQRNLELSTDQALANFAVFACITRIAQDIAKLRFVLQRKTDDGIWVEANSPAFSPVLGKPNAFQNHIQFKESWLIAKLEHGNSYMLKGRDNRGVVTQLFVLDPQRVQPLVTETGAVYYRLQADNLSGIAGSGIVVPASEIIHDRMNCLFHPLVGISPLFAAGCAASNGLQIQQNSTAFFANGSTPGGLLLVPGEIKQDDADRLQSFWMANYTGTNAGRIAVLTGGMTYEPLRQTAADSQLIEQLKMSAEVVCACFHVPPYKIGIGVLPTQTNIEALGIQYQEECLQFHMESMEACLDEGLGLDSQKDGGFYGVSLDDEGLSRMDTTQKATAHAALVGGGIEAPNEARRKFNLAKSKGGDSPYLQVQNYSLEALASRDANEPFAKPTPAAVPALPAPDTPPPADQQAAKFLADLVESMKGYA